MMHLPRGGSRPQQRRIQDADGPARKAVVTRIRDAEPETKYAPHRIEVKRTDALAHIVPASVWSTKPFTYKPQTFVPESPRLNQKFIEPDHQMEGLDAFLEDPNQDMTYAVAGNPDDLKAKYFAAYLVQAHLKAMGAQANVQWAGLYSTYNGTEALKDSFNPNKSRPTLLVISNLTPNSTARRYEEARDLIERYQGRIPLIVVCAGEDPLSFLSQRLYSPVHALAYFCGPLIRQREEFA